RKVRLDHLLSKEHLPAKAGQEPAPAECVGGVLDGGDTGDAAVGNGLLLLVRPFGVGNAGVGAAGGGVQTSCWVLRGQAPVGVVVFLVSARGGHQTACRGWFVRWVCGGGAACGVGRCLRIAQWTRASLL